MHILTHLQYHAGDKKTKNVYFEHAIVSGQPNQPVKGQGNERWPLLAITSNYL
jgi:hypothetical protein